METYKVFYKKAKKLKKSWNKHKMIVIIYRYYMLKRVGMLIVSIVKKWENLCKK